MPDTIASASDAELLNIASQVLTAIEIVPTNFGLTAGFVIDFELARDTFSTDLSAHVAAQAAARAQTVTKDASRDLLEGLIRDVRLSAKAAKTSETEVASLGIPTQSGAAPANATVPAAQVDTSERLRHTITWTDAATLNNRRKPRGTMGAEIWVKLGDPPPGNEKDCTFLTLDAFTPYMFEYDPADAGNTAHYMLRWRLRDGSVSAWGETIAATITG